MAEKGKPTEPIRIAYVIDQMGLGGTERQLATLINGLDPKRFTPYLAMIHKYEVCFDLQCESFVFPTGRLAAPKAVGNIWKMATMFRRNRIQIAQTFFPDSSFVGILAAKLARVPIVISSRRDMGFWYTSRNIITMKFLNLLTDRILVNSESVRQNTARNEKADLDRIDTIYNGLDTTGFDDELTQAEAKQAIGFDQLNPLIGIVSNLNREVKRLDVFIDAIPAVLKKIPSARFVLVGQGYLRPKLEEQCRSLGVAEAVKFTGSISDVKPYLRAFDIGVNTSDSEGFSNAIIEYMLAGIPAVVSDVSGNNELVEDGADGYCFPPGDSDSLADKLIRLLQAPDKAEEMGARGREKAIQNFSAETMIEKSMDYYESLFSQLVAARARSTPQAEQSANGRA